MPYQYCPDCDELLCKLNSDIKENFRGWCNSCKLIWSFSENNEEDLDEGVKN